MKSQLTDNELRYILAQGIEMNNEGMIIYGFLKRHMREMRQYVGKGKRKLIEDINKEFYREAKAALKEQGIDIENLPDENVLDFRTRSKEGDKSIQ